MKKKKKGFLDTGNVEDLSHSQSCAFHKKYCGQNNTLQMVFGEENEQEKLAKINTIQQFLLDTRLSPPLLKEFMNRLTSDKAKWCKDAASRFKTFKSKYKENERIHGLKNGERLAYDSQAPNVDQSAKFVPKEGNIETLFAWIVNAREIKEAPFPRDVLELYNYKGFNQGI